MDEPHEIQNRRLGQPAAAVVVDPSPLPRVVAGLAILAGAIVAAISGGRLPWLRPLMGYLGLGPIKMNINAALGLFVLGVGLMLLVPKRACAVRRWVGRACAALALLVGVLTLSEQAVGWDLGIDGLLLEKAPASMRTAGTSRMPTPTATSLVLAGAALLIVSRRNGRGLSAAQGMALGVFFIGLLWTVGLLYGAKDLHSVLHLTPISGRTAVTLLLLGAGLLLAKPEGGLMAEVMSPGTGGALVRRLLIPGLAVPVGLGWLFWTGARWGLFSAPLAVSLLVLSFVVIFSAMAYFTGRGVNRSEEALRQSELRFRQLAEGVHEAFWVYDVAGRRLEYINPAGERITGRTSEELGRDFEAWQKIFHPEDLAGVLSKIELAARGEPYQIEYRVVRLDGAVRWVRGRGIPVRDPSGRVFRIVGISEDVTEQKEAEEELRRHQAELAHVSRLSAMGEMAAELAHEINQPLHAVNNYTRGAIRRLLKLPERDEELLMVLEQVGAEAGRAAQIVRRLGKFVQKRQPLGVEVRLNNLVEDVLLLSRRELEQRRVKVTVELADGLPAVRGDPIQIEQVLVNLIRNAAEAMDETPQDERDLRVVTARDGDDMIRVDVCDRGKGIPADDLEKIFQPFFTTKPEGVGMGLAISRSIAELYTGRLWVTPNPDGGCTFHLALPAGA